MIYKYKKDKLNGADLEEIINFAEATGFIWDLSDVGMWLCIDTLKGTLYFADDMSALTLHSISDVKNAISQYDILKNHEPEEKKIEVKADEVVSIEGKNFQFYSNMKPMVINLRKNRISIVIS